MERCPDLGFESYDRLFPSQDTMPGGGFGNLIALPLQSDPRQKGNSVFVDDELRPYDDQWAFLSSHRRMSRAEVTTLVEHASVAGRILECAFRSMTIRKSLGRLRRRGDTPSSRSLV